MKDSGDNHLRELLWRPGLTAAEEARLKQIVAAQPDMEAEFAEEVRLNQLLGTLPEAPLASNFTARVMQAVEQEESRISRATPRLPVWRASFGWVSRLAMAGLVVAAGIFTFQKHQINQRAELAQSVANFSNVGALPSEWLRDFETIQHLSSASPVDDELLAALR